MSKVLIAHYDPQRRGEIVASLRERLDGGEIREAADGKDLLSLLEEDEPDIVIVSAVLPRVLGFEVCRQVKAQTRASVVILSDADDGFSRGKALQAGADLVFAEPLDEAALDAMVDVREKSHDPLDLSRAGSRTHHERLLASIIKESSGSSMLSRFSDPVTGLYDRNYIRLRIEEEYKKTKRYGAPLSIVLADVDNYDEIVSRFGPATGDMSVVEVASVFLCESRDIDVAGRLDKARFVFLLPNTDIDGARIMADRVFNELLERQIPTDDEPIALRISVGIASCPNEKVSSVDEFLDLAVRGLKTATKNGGNKICVWGEA